MAQAYYLFDGDSCVEVAMAGGLIGVRDSEDDRCNQILVFSQPQWRTFIADLRSPSVAKSRHSQLD